MQGNIGSDGKASFTQTDENSIQLGREVGILRTASVIFGFPGKNQRTIDATTKFILELDPDDILYNIATPYPGTPLFDIVTKMGWPRVVDWSKYDCYTPKFETPELTLKDLQEIRETHTGNSIYAPNLFSACCLKATHLVILKLRYL